MADEQPQAATTVEQQPTEVKKEESVPNPTSAEDKTPSAPAPAAEDKKIEKVEEEAKKDTKSPKQKRKNSKPRSRSNSLNRGATAKEWKPKGTEPVTKTSTINANAPPFVSQHARAEAGHHPQQHHQHQHHQHQHQHQHQEEEGSHTEPVGHELNTPWTFWFSRKSKKGKAHAAEQGSDAVATAVDASKGDQKAGEHSEGEKDKEKEKAQPQQPQQPQQAKGKKKKGQQQQQQNENPHRSLLTLLGTARTVEEFWTLYSHLQKPSALPKESNYSFFRHRNEPMWETFPKGGCYILRVKKQEGKLDQLWEELLFASIGEAFEDANVVGVVVSIRSKEDALSIWVKSNSNPNRPRIGEKLKEILELDKSAVLGYKTNASSMRDKSTYKNAKKILLAS